MENTNNNTEVLFEKKINIDTNDDELKQLKNKIISCELQMLLIQLSKNIWANAPIINHISSMLNKATNEPIKIYTYTLFAIPILKPEDEILQILNKIKDYDVIEKFLKNYYMITKEIRG